MLALPGFAARPATTAASSTSGWTQQGITHYGDHIPPEYAAQEQHVINAQGVEIDRLDAQKTPEQLAADDQKKAEAEQSRNRDRNLLNTYASVQEIERLRDQRVTLLSDQIKVTSQFLEVLNGRLKKLRAGSLHYKPYSSDPKAPAMPDQVAEDLVRVGNDIRTQEQNLQREAQRGDDDEQAIRERYRSLQRTEGHPLTPKTRVLLGVTGGIAAYKSPDLVRRLMERGADVQVVMTDAAQKFVSPMSFQAVSGRPTRSDLWDDAAEAAMGHIELARWAQVVLIAPASADFMARLAGGRADDLLSTLCLATEAPLVLAPAMNRVMWANKATQANVETLISRGIRILGPDSGNQACGEVGVGRMWEPVKLAESLLERPANAGLLAGLNILITAGPTRERIDPVRYLTNRSSGKMGFAVAAAAREAGAHVTIVTGPVQLPTPAGITRINVESARDMYAAVHRQVADADVFIAAAAVADFQPVTRRQAKNQETGRGGQARSRARARHRQVGRGHGQAAVRGRDSRPRPTTSKRMRAANSSARSST